MSVGRSGRTPGKHRAINSLVGREMAMVPRAMRHGSFVFNRLLVIDATAGDGVGLLPSEDGDSTPAIVHRHLGAVARADGERLPVDWLLFERDVRASADLSARMSHISPTLPARVRVGVVSADSTTEVVTILREDRQAVLYLDDPNHSGGSTLTPDVVKWLFSRSGATIYASIATNSAGAGKHDKDAFYTECRERYENLLNVAERNKKGAVLCRLDGDPHRWGYLWIGPAANEARTAREFYAAFASGVEWREGLKLATPVISTGFRECRETIKNMTTQGKFRDTVSQPLLPFAYIGRTA